MIEWDNYKNIYAYLPPGVTFSALYKHQNQNTNKFQKKRPRCYSYPVKHIFELFSPITHCTHQHFLDVVHFPAMPVDFNRIGKDFIFHLILIKQKSINLQERKGPPFQRKVSEWNESSLILNYNKTTNAILFAIYYLLMLFVYDLLYFFIDSCPNTSVPSRRRKQ